MSLHPPRVVQLSGAASLAVVFGDEDESAAESHRSSATGLEVFADFKAQNRRSFWNKRLVKAMDEVHFQGWLDNLVLFIRGSSASLEVLREAWMRRALKSAAGLVIKVVGDLTPLQMSPIPQSQFIPLAEVLCSVISDMNSSQVVVSQETLVNHMSRSHPGITIPTQDILYSTLGTLIKERKIYHTGEGYFIVTPQTYFITSNLDRENTWWTSGSAEEPTSPPPITYLLSNEICVEGIQTTPAAHCKSCSCFNALQTSTSLPPNLPPPAAVPDQQSVSVSVSEGTAKSLKWPRPSDHKPSVHHQTTSTAADCHVSVLSKATGIANTAGRKEKDNKLSRRFGLSLFRRNGAKKEKPKKEYVSFSGQFPPEEWPVRDEDDLNNLPRDLEHAIIKRINPELTVDNLTRHTVLMKKLEERREKAVDKGVDKGMSTDIVTSSKARHHHSRSMKRSAQKSSRSKRRVHSSREKQRDRIKSRLSACPHAFPEREDLIPTHLPVEIPIDEPDKAENAVEGKLLYKKRIENPFPPLETGSLHPAANWEHSKLKEGKPSGKDRTTHRSKSWDQHQTKMRLAIKEQTTMSPTSEDTYDQDRETNRDLLPQSDLNLNCDSLAGYNSTYPQSCTLRIDDKLRRRREGSGMQSRENLHLKDDGNQFLDADLSNMQQYANSDQIWTKSSLQRKHSLRLTSGSQTPDELSTNLNSKDATTIPVSREQSTLGMVEPVVDDLASVTEHEDDRRLFQRADHLEDEDTGSSLCLNEEEIVPNCLHQHLVYHQCDTKSKRHDSIGHCCGSNFHHQQLASIDSHTMNQRGTSLTLGKLDVTTWMCQYPQQSTLSLQDEPSSREEDLVKETVHESCLNSEHPELPGAFDSSIFDYCPVSEAESDAETIRKSTDEADGESTHWTEAKESPGEDYHQMGFSRTTGAAFSGPRAGETGEAGELVENHSITGDSGIDSPRNHISLASSNTVILEGLKRRGFLQNLDKLHSKSNAIRPQSSLLQLTPVMNV
ncbi:storkhead-box protein 1 [Stigmatopora argus]